MVTKWLGDRYLLGHYTKEVSSLVTQGPSFTSVKTTGGHWLAGVFHLFGTRHAALGTDKLKQMLCTLSTTVWPS